MTDPIADFLIRIKNASLAGGRLVNAPYSKVKESLALILQKEGYLAKVETKETNNKKNLAVSLSEKRKLSVIEVKRISRPGCRVYAKAQEVFRLGRGVGLVILSTPVGLMTNKEARKKHLGGEVLCKII